ncbi:MAG: phosphoribosylformylglycinamidine synthase subunit PurQ [Candidatus Peribacteraceae bacterium]|nr:phosphoribosylformylglycinamidine synthase subunit PurQ [Candidatus Peribacteraceae bacterium]
MHKSLPKPLIAVPSFPGSNGEVDNIRTLKRCGFDCFVFRWNDSLEKLKDVDGYFFGAGFSYEDRGRSGMVAARDPLFRFMAEEAERGKVIVGNCNGAQVLIESGLIPLGDGLKMCLARNAIRGSDNSWRSPGFLNEWVWIKPVCAEDRCATSGWKGTMHIPIAHGEGRFVTRDPDLIAALKDDDQIAFAYCTENGEISADPSVTPNGSTMGIAGICNKAGNVVALMPHPERTPLGDPYFLSIKRWIASKKDAGLLTRGERQKGKRAKGQNEIGGSPIVVSNREPMPVEIFIDTIITNNEERTVEQAARRIEPTVRLKQYKYVGLKSDCARELLSSLSFFNPHKELAFVRQNGKIHSWDSDECVLKPAPHSILKGISLLRRDEPDTGAAGLGDGAETGVCYDCREVTQDQLLKTKVCEVFCNPHSSSLERMCL